MLAYSHKLPDDSARLSVTARGRVDSAAAGLLRILRKGSQGLAILHKLFEAGNI